MDSNKLRYIVLHRLSKIVQEIFICILAGVPDIARGKNNQDLKDIR